MAAAPPPDPRNIIQALTLAANRIEQNLTESSGLQPGQLPVLIHVASHQPVTIPAVATGVGRGYRWALAMLAGLHEAGLVVRWPPTPARFALSDAGALLVDQMNMAVWDTITSAHGWPAAVIAGEVLDRLSDPLDAPTPTALPGTTPSLTNVAVAAQFVGVEAQLIDVWVRSGSLRPPPWDEHDFRNMSTLPGSVTAVWPALIEGARSGQKFADVTKRVGLTTQKVASAIGRDSILRSELDDAFMLGRDPNIKHGRRLAYRQGCWCPECRKAQLGPAH